MAPRGNKEPEWTEWAWSDKRQQWKTELKDHQGNVWDTHWEATPRFSSQNDTTSLASYGDAPVVTSPTSPNYSYESSTRQGPTGYQNSSTAPAFQGQTPPNTRTATSGFPGPYQRSPGLPATFNYQPVPGGSTVPPLYGTNTTRSGWPAPGGIQRQYQNQPLPTASNFFQGSYDEASRRTVNSVFPPQYEAPYVAGTTQSYSGSQNNVTAASMSRPAAQYQSRVQPGPYWSPDQDDVPTRPVASSRPPQQHSAPLREATLPENRNQDSRSIGQAAPSGFVMNTTSTNRSSLFPGTVRDRPQSIYVAYGTSQVPVAPSSQIGGAVPFENDSDGEIAREMSNSSIRDSTIYQNQERPPRRRQDLGEIPSFNQDVPNLESSTSALSNDEDNESEGDMAQEIAGSRSRSRRRSSLYPSHDTRKSAVYIRDAVISKPRGMGSSSLQARSQSRRRRDDSRTPRQEIREEISSDSEDPQTDFERLRSYQSSIADVPRDKKPSVPSLRPQQPRERPPIVERPAPRRQGSSREYTKATGRGQKHSQDLERDKQSSTHKPPTVQHTTSGARTISTNNVQMSSEPLHQDYTVHKSKHFVKGAVFKIIWSEPFGESHSQRESETSDGTTCEHASVEYAKFGQHAYHSTRRFVIVKEREGHCICVPILTYRSQGTNKPGVKAENHAIIYTGERPPDPLPGEEGINFRPVRVESKNSREKLAPESRVNYSKVYTVEHNVKVCFIGKIHKDSKASFFTDFKYVDGKDSK